MAWQLEGEDRILAWLEASSHAPTKEAVQGWVVRLLADPDGVPGIPVPGDRLPVLVDNVPRHQRLDLLACGRPVPGCAHQRGLRAADV